MYSQCIVKQDEEDKEAMKQQIMESLNKKTKALEERLSFVMKKHSEGIYSDEDFLRFKREIDEEKKEVKKMLENNNYSQSAATIEDLDINEIKDNFIKILEVYQTEEISAADKNDLLRSIFEKVTIEVIEKGTKTQAPKIEVEAILTANFWESNF